MTNASLPIQAEISAQLSEQIFFKRHLQIREESFSPIWILGWPDIYSLANRAQPNRLKKNIIMES